MRGQADEVRRHVHRRHLSPGRAEGPRPAQHHPAVRRAGDQREGRAQRAARPAAPASPRSRAALRRVEEHAAEEEMLAQLGHLGRHGREVAQAPALRHVLPPAAAEHGVVGQRVGAERRCGRRPGAPSSRTRRPRPSPSRSRARATPRSRRRDRRSRASRTGWRSRRARPRTAPRACGRTGRAASEGSGSTWPWTRSAESSAATPAREPAGGGEDVRVAEREHGAARTRPTPRLRACRRARARPARGPAPDPERARAISSEPSVEPSSTTITS